MGNAIPKWPQGVPNFRKIYQMATSVPNFHKIDITKFPIIRTSTLD
jgi:hypothetical protein